MLAIVANLLCAVLFAGLLQVAYFVDRQLFIISALVGLGFILTLAKLDKIEIALSETRRQQVVGAFGKLVFFLIACALVIGSSWAVHHLRATGRLERWLAQAQGASAPGRGGSTRQTAGPGNDIKKVETTADSSSKEYKKATENRGGEGRVELVEVIENKQPDGE
jgi:hypothetical protein